MDTEKLWRDYRNTRDSAIRQELVLNYLWLVKYLAGRLAVKLPPCLSQEDLESCGVFGLMEAIDKYDPSRGINFESYAQCRVRGAMIDEMRRLNWLPRSAWDRLKRIGEVKEKIQSETGQPASDEMLAKELGIKVEEVRKAVRNYHMISLSSLEETTLTADGEQVRWGNLLEDPLSPDPLEFLETQEAQQILIQAIDSLSEKDRIVLALYYKEGLTLKEIGRVLEISESRVCQIHARALDRLRNKLKEVAYERCG